MGVRETPARHFSGDEVGAVNIDLENAREFVGGVGFGGEVLADAGGGDEDVGFFVGGDDGGEGGGDLSGAGDVS